MLEEGRQLCQAVDMRHAIARFSGCSDKYGVRSKRSCPVEGARAVVHNQGLAGRDLEIGKKPRIKFRPFFEGIEEIRSVVSPEAMSNSHAFEIVCQLNRG